MPYYIPGIELTLSHKGSIVHILGHYVDPANRMLNYHQVQKCIV